MWEHQRLEDSICPIRPLGNMEEPSSLNTSKIVSIEDCRHSKFKWLTLKRIHVRARLIILLTYNCLPYSPSIVARPDRPRKGMGDIGENN